jgi:hypothetical protein
VFLHVQTAVQMTDDHKPTLPKEKERIEAAGGWVHKNRVNGLLAVSRSFGDINYKQVEESLFEDTPECEGLTNATDKAIANAQKMINWSLGQQVMGLPEVCCLWLSERVRMWCWVRVLFYDGNQI